MSNWLNVVPIQLESGKWTMGEESEIDHKMHQVMFADEYDTKEEAWQAIDEEEAEEDGYE